ncbi:MAG TPA: chemotaxis protein CheB [Kofleriaceae bacterium]|nr:chemotaxis protein CheB [Kofleriaceae bacterium]
MTGRVTGQPIRVLIVDDSPLACAALTDLITGPTIDVVGTAQDGEDAIAQAVALRPDVVTMDLMMPGEGGDGCIERLMLMAPTRIIVVTAADRTGTAAMRAIAAGALEVVDKPAGFSSAAVQTWAARLAETITLMADVPVVTRRAGVAPGVVGRAIDAIGIAASTGGPPVLAEILRPLRGRRFPPILIAQHLGQGFAGGLARWLGEVTGLPALTAAAGGALVPGTLYLAPDLHDLVLGGERLGIPPVDGVHHPCADRLFRSLAVALGGRALGIVLSGMGDDGAAGLRAIRAAGGLTIAQDPRTCVLGGMPGAAIAAGAAELVLDPRGIAAALFGLSRAA